jgi:hypothetical protein
MDGVEDDGVHKFDEVVGKEVDWVSESENSSSSNSGRGNRRIAAIPDN